MVGAPKRPTHRIIKRVFFSSMKEPDEVGTQLTLTKAQAEKLEAHGFVEALKDAKVVDATGADSKALAAKDKEIADLTKKLENAEADLKTANEALVAKSTGNAA